MVAVTTMSVRSPFYLLILGKSQPRKCLSRGWERQMPERPRERAETGNLGEGVSRLQEKGDSGAG